MTENDVVEYILSFICKRFPKACTKCGRQYNGYKEYLQTTTPVGRPISYDVSQDDWRPKNPLGTAIYHNCACGTTMSIGSSHMRIDMIWRLYRWSKKEIKQQGITMEELLERLRRKIDKRALER